MVQKVLAAKSLSGVQVAALFAGYIYIFYQGFLWLFLVGSAGFSLLMRLRVVDDGAASLSS